MYSSYMTHFPFAFASAAVVQDPRTWFRSQPSLIACLSVGASVVHVQLLPWITWPFRMAINHSHPLEVIIFITFWPSLTRNWLSTLATPKVQVSQSSVGRSILQHISPGKCLHEPSDNNVTSSWLPPFRINRSCLECEILWPCEKEPHHTTHNILKQYHDTISDKNSRIQNQTQLFKQDKNKTNTILYFKHGEHKIEYLTQHTLTSDPFRWRHHINTQTPLAGNAYMQMIFYPESPMAMGGSQSVQDFWICSWLERKDASRRVTSNCKTVSFSLQHQD